MEGCWLFQRVFRFLDGKHPAVSVKSAFLLGRKNRYKLLWMKLGGDVGWFVLKTGSCKSLVT